MAAQPSDEAIDLICNMTGIPRSEAIARLKGNNNDPNQAINEYFDNLGNNPYAWDDTQFNTDRDGSKNSTAFDIQGPDDHGSGYFSGAPSRPPSRTSNRSPMGRVISLAAEHERANPENRMTALELADVDLQRALAQSAQEAGLPPQESGIIGTNTVHFGPANRSDYIESQWAMIPVSSGPAHEVLPDPAPEDRKRELDSPAFLKPSIHSHRLASILAIYHEIPLAREIFLDRNDLLSDYGHDPDWWAGRAIGYKSTITNVSSGNAVNSSLSRDEKEVIREIQRLMAFLDKTERGYGSAEILANLDIVSGAQCPDVETKFFEAWKFTHEDMPTLGSIFSQGFQPKDIESDDDSENVSKDFAILDLNLPNADDVGDLETLYDISDKALWASSGLNIAGSAYLTHVGDIIGFRLTGTKSSRSIKIPEVWYPDRYLEESRGASLNMRKQKAIVRDKMSKIFALENKLNYYILPGGKTIKTQDLFNASMMHDSELIMENDVSHVDSLSVDTDMNPHPYVRDKMDVTIELQRVMASIDKKLKALDAEKDKARASLRELSKLYTEPSKSPGQLPLRRYTLRGVSTTKYVTYLRRQSEPDLIEMDLDTSGLSSTDQWWRIEWVSTELKPVAITHRHNNLSADEYIWIQKVTQDRVFVAAMEESDTSILIYANDRAMAEPVKPLPDTLEAFVRSDNLAFSSELPYRHEVQDSQCQMPSPVSPGKRKYDESSDSSVDAPPRYSETGPRWGGMSPVRQSNDVLVHHRELNGSDDGESSGHNLGTITSEPAGEAHTRGGNGLDALIGHNSHGLSSLTFPDQNNSGNKCSMDQEMKEKKGMPFLLPSAIEGLPRQLSYPDSMDVDDLARESQETIQNIDLSRDRAELE